MVVDETLMERVREVAAAGMGKVVSTADKTERGLLSEELKQTVLTELDPEGARSAEIASLLSSYKKSFMRSMIVNQEVRIDGRKFDQIRPISS